ncbi:Porin omp2b precursor [Labrenzia sp. THAF191b]|uniref:porin n=1 Tax=unclassified Labrenzia TaxID=2648686 RepID=UPI001268C97C|nr:MULTISPECIES: porin [unclassified Labrenzia]QFT00649.1 Porin omp2b precursor [Labrenzia sp. THAF191b]QFT06962.1 Porin omp2b precursor [Labrenzia sp. THAF191a]QFT18506.1 Porin omp2b precursor [Labrenzia sp. THAF187b]
MKLKSLMLGAAAAAAATTAQAADLPVAPEPVDYVRVCDAYGARFYYIPGTETCLRVGGRVRTQVIVNNTLDNGAWGNRDSDGYSWLSRGYLYLDARTATEFGTLRAYVSMYSTVTNGAGSSTLDNAYIQWGGLTAGLLTSNFDIFTGQTFMGVVTRNWSDQTVNQIAYTAAFGNGFSATIALEDRSHREVGTYGGTRAPDLVAALGVSQGWGSAQLSGALHQVYPDRANAHQTGATNNGADDSFGWAIGGGVAVNIPMASPGSNIFFQGFYADGALSYIGAGSTVGGVAVSDYGPTSGTSTGYSLSAGAYIQATSTIGLALDGSYMDIDQPAGATDLTRWAIDGSVQWEPVSGFVMGADVGYANTDPSSASDVDELLFGVRMQRTF